MDLSINGMSFSLLEIIIWLIIAAICGAIAEMLVGYSLGGLFASIAIGLLGAILGTWLAHQLGLPSVLRFSYGDTSIELLWTILGAALLVFILSLARYPSRRNSRRHY